MSFTTQIGVTGFAPSSNGGRIAYTIHAASTSTAILFIHGWCGNQHIWRNQLELLETAGCLITIDLAGSGQSRLPDVSQPIIAHAHDVVSVADFLSLENIVLVGHSMGGPVAMEAAILLETRCRLLIGVDSFTDPYFYSRRSNGEIERRCADIADGFDRYIRAMIGRITAADLDSQTREWIANEMIGIGPDAALSTLRGLLDWDISERWPNLRCPCDTINSLDMMGGEQLELDGLVVTSIADCGHFPMIERPDQFNHQLMQVLGRHGLA